MPDPNVPAPNEHHLIAFAGCDYLGLSKHPDVIQTIRDALPELGVSTGASRTTTGNHPAYDLLESTASEFFASEAAVLTLDGSLANSAALEGIAAMEEGLDRVVIIDELAHPSLTNAARVSGFRIERYRHRDALHAGELVERTSATSSSVVIVTDAVFAATGVLAPLRTLAEIAERRSAWLVIDDCHGTGTRGSNGRGSLSAESLAISDQVVMTTTLAKGVGVAGGIIGSREELGTAIRSRATAYIATTPIPPALAVGSTTALSLMAHDHARHDRLSRNVKRAHELVTEAGFHPIAAAGPIIAFAADNPDAITAHCRDRGVLVPTIAYPGGPSERYIRLAVNSEHTEDDLKQLAQALRS
ncbi:MAG: pyridoxal phosphate-dependent aminotransferase family protein [Planctomycetota bacterium]